MSSGQRLGLIVNPLAGRGGAHNLMVAARLVDALRPDGILVGPGNLGSAFRERRASPRRAVPHGERESLLEEIPRHPAAH